MNSPLFSFADQSLIIRFIIIHGFDIMPL